MVGGTRARNPAAALPGALAVVNSADAELVGLLEGLGLKVSVTLST